MKSEDIARIAGVSRSTVSRVINNYSNVPDETRRRIMAVIEAEGYEPNTSARVLAGKGLNTLGLFIVSTADKQNPNRLYGNNYFAPFVDAVVDCANAAGFYVLIHTVYAQDDYARVKQAFLQKRVDGGIVLGSQRDTAAVMDIADKGYPLTLIDFDTEEIARGRHHSRSLATVNAMDGDGARMALRYLMDLGHRDIAILTGRMNTFSGRVRYQAYEETLKDAGITPEKKWILRGEFLRRVASEQTRKMLSEKKLPTAIFACNDDMALGAMEALREAGIRVPEDISVVGFDDVPVAAQLQPALTTVRIPVFDMARKAVEHLVHVVEAGADSFSAYSFPTELVIRDSCGINPQNL